jgi:hypothetical protein
MIVSKKTIVTMAVVLVGLTAAMPRLALAAPVVQECSPPGQAWGPGNTFRAKIDKFADNTAVYRSQNFSTPNPERWFTSTPFPWAGGQITNGMGQPNIITPEGDGYRVTVQARGSYYAHFACAPVAAAPAARPPAPR